MPTGFACEISINFVVGYFPRAAKLGWVCFDLVNLALLRILRY